MPLYPEDKDAIAMLRKLRRYVSNTMGEDWTDTLYQLEEAIRERGRMQS